jgi:hypothetical protein
LEGLLGVGGEREQGCHQTNEDLHQFFLSLGLWHFIVFS